MLKRPMCASLTCTLCNAPRAGSFWANFSTRTLCQLMSRFRRPCCQRTNRRLRLRAVLTRSLTSLLPKQVTPFLIIFPDVELSNVGSVRMTPTSSLISASADPVIEIDNEKLNPAPDATLTGQLINQSGQIVNVAHVLGTFYDKTGQVVWVADQFADRALLPQSPVSFSHPHS